jgi:actin-like protein 6A
LVFVIFLDLPNTTSSYQQYAVREIVQDLKENLSRCSETTFDASMNANIPLASYELPDGQTVDIGAERFAIPELMFSAEVIFR